MVKLLVAVVLTTTAALAVAAETPYELCMKQRATNGMMNTVRECQQYMSPDAQKRQAQHEEAMRRNQATIDKIDEANRNAQAKKR